MYIAGIDPSINGTGVFKFELDSSQNIKSESFMGFTTVKKEESNNIHWFKASKFTNYIEKNKWMYETILEFIKEAEYVSIEDYAFAATGKLFHIGEFVGGLKIKVYEANKQIRMYEPTVVKKFATTKGNCDKISMCDAYDKDPNVIPLTFLNNYKSPKTDIVDAYYIAKLLQIELQLRSANIALNTLSSNVIQIFNTVSKSNPTNILARDFLKK